MGKEDMLGCLFKEPGIVNSCGIRIEPEVVCSQRVSGRIPTANYLVRLGCVGEEDCPVMQTHRAVMELLEISRKTRSKKDKSV